MGAYRHLGSIQILDLSLNDLSGVIPWCFHNFTSIDHKVDDSCSTTSSYTTDPLRSYGREYAYNEYITWRGKNYKCDKNLRLFRIIKAIKSCRFGTVKPLKEQFNIPESIGKMKLESLDVSHNQLFGKIPMGLTDIAFLAFLDLSDNQLWVRIPAGTQLQSFDASKYLGNKGLCGPPLNVTCSGDGKLQESSTSCETGDERYLKEDDAQWVDMSWFYMGIGVGFGIGFVGVCGLALFFNTSWRRVYFNQLLNRWRTSNYGARFKRPP